LPIRQNSATSGGAHDAASSATLRTCATPQSGRVREPGGPLAQESKESPQTTPGRWPVLAYLGDMRAERAVHAGARLAEQHDAVDACPVWVRCAAVGTAVVARSGCECRGNVVACAIGATGGLARRRKLRNSGLLAACDTQHRLVASAH
jgi:hypothetical protein